MKTIEENSVVTIVSNHCGYYRAKVSIFISTGNYTYNATSQLSEVIGYKPAKDKNYILAKFCLSKNSYSEQFEDIIREKTGFKGVISCCEINF